LQKRPMFLPYGYCRRKVYTTRMVCSLLLIINYTRVRARARARQGECNRPLPHFDKYRLLYRALLQKRPMFLPFRECRRKDYTTRMVCSLLLIIYHTCARARARARQRECNRPLPHLDEARAYHTQTVYDSQMIIVCRL